MAHSIADPYARRCERIFRRGLLDFLLRHALIAGAVGSLLELAVRAALADWHAAQASALRAFVPFGLFGAYLGLINWNIAHMGYARWCRARPDQAEASSTADAARAPPRGSKGAAFILALLVIGGLGWVASGFYLSRLDDKVQDALNRNQAAQVERDARNLLVLARLHPLNWCFGNAIMHGHVALGLVAVQQGDIAEARQQLLDAGNTPGSPQLDSFGPNMLLAKALLEHGEQGAVLGYFDQCRKFWRMDDGDLDHWTEAVRAGGIPDFGANLLF